MLKTPKEVLEEIKKWAEDFRVIFSDHLSGKKENHILKLRQKVNPQLLQRVKEVLTLIEEALKKDEIAGWQKLYKEWNGDPDISRDKYNGKQAILGGPYDLRTYLEEWEWSVQQQEQQELIKKLQNLLQTAGINPDDENVQEQVEGIKKTQDDLTDLGIDKTKVKEMIEKERNEHESKIKWLVRSFVGKKMWEKIKIKAQIEVKK